MSTSSRVARASEPPHSRHYQFQVGFGARALFRTPHVKVAVQLPYSIQHLLDEAPQFRVCSSIVRRVSRWRLG